MTLQGLLTALGNIAINDRMVSWAGAGSSVYSINDLTIRDYPIFFASPTGTHRVEDNWTTYQLTLFFIDRLLEDNSNDMDIQSTAIEVLKNLIKKAAEQDGVVAVSDEYTITLFVDTEKFKDRCSGAYATVEFSIKNDSTCIIYSNEEYEPEPEPVPPTPGPPSGPGDSGVTPDPSSQEYEDQYLTFHITAKGAVSLHSSSTKNVEYSLNNGDWTTLEVGEQLTVKKGDIVRWRAEHINGKHAVFASAGNTRFYVTGNAYSMEYYDHFSQIRNLGYRFDNLFYGCKGVTSAKNMVLPATNLLSSDSYAAMFRNCSNLREAPELPATGLSKYCYYWMFGNCANLTKAPVLPATTLKEGCYWQMFNVTSISELTMYAETGLTGGPEIPTYLYLRGAMPKGTLYISQAALDTFNRILNQQFIPDIGVARDSTIPDGWSTVVISN